MAAGATTGAPARPRSRRFLTGFLEGGSSIGRPVDIAAAADGTLYVSDDSGGVIYRVRYPVAAASGG